MPTTTLEQAQSATHTEVLVEENKEASNSAQSSPAVPNLDRLFRRPARVSPQFEDLRLRHVKLEAGQSIHFDEPFDALYVVKTGFLKTMRMQKEGRPQIVEFPLQGDILHTDALRGDGCTLKTVALTLCELILLPKAKRGVAGGVTNAMRLRQVRRQQGIRGLLASLDAEARLVRFLNSLAARHAAVGYKDMAITFPFNAEDLGSYLNLTAEAVHAVLTSLSRKNILTVGDGAIHIANTHVLGGELVSLVLQEMPSAA